MFQKFYEFNVSSIFYKMREKFPSMRVRVRMYQTACVSRRMRETWKVCTVVPGSTETPGDIKPCCRTSDQMKNIRSHTKFMGNTGLVQMGYGARTFSTHIDNRGGTFFRKHAYGANTSFIFMD